MPGKTKLVSELIERAQQEILEDWLQEQAKALSRRRDLITDTQLREQSTALLGPLTAGFRSGADPDGVEWQPARARLEEIRRARAMQGFAPSETAMFVMSIKQPLMKRMKQANASLDDVWEFTEVIDK